MNDQASLIDLWAVLLNGNPKGWRWGAWRCIAVARKEDGWAAVLEADRHPILISRENLFASRSKATAEAKRRNRVARDALARFKSVGGLAVDLGWIERSSKEQES